MSSSRRSLSLFFMNSNMRSMYRRSSICYSPRFSKSFSSFSPSFETRSRFPNISRKFGINRGFGRFSSFSSDSLNHSTPNQDSLGENSNRSEEKRFCLIYTCKVCGTRDQRFFTHRAYYHGVVIIECLECKNLHLIADNLGWFPEAEGRNIEEFAEMEGTKVRKIKGKEAAEFFKKEGILEGFSVSEQVEDQNELEMISNTLEE